MFTGTIIDELIAAVERAEEHAELHAKQGRQQDSYLPLYQTTSTDATLAGVA
jgi:hypothetical protein